MMETPLPPSPLHPFIPSVARPQAMLVERTTRFREPGMAAEEAGERRADAVLRPEIAIDRLLLARFGEAAEAQVAHPEIVMSRDIAGIEGEHPGKDRRGFGRAARAEVA